MTLTDRHLETTAGECVCLDLGALAKMQVLGWGPRLGNSYKILLMLLLLVCVPHFEWQDQGHRGAAPKPCRSRPVLSPTAPSPLRGAVEGQRSVPKPRQLSIEAAPGSPLQSLNHGKPPPWGSCPGGHRPALRPQGWLWTGVGGWEGDTSSTAQPQPLLNRLSGQAGDARTPATSRASSGHPHPGPAQSPAGILGLPLHPWGLPWLPNSAGLVRYLEEKPQVGARACFQGGPALGVRRRPAAS